MSLTIVKYTLNDFENIKFEGFDFNIPDKTLAFISELASLVGSPSYIKTPIFKKRVLDNPINTKKENKPLDNWGSVRNNTFQATKIEQKQGLELQIDLIRSHLNKISDKNYIDYRNKIIEIFDELVKNNISNENMMRICSSLFEIASNNRFYSKLYADLYSDLITNYDIMNQIFENSLNSFMELFDNIDYVDPGVDYDKFCKNNKDNERRRSLSAFFLNLMYNKIISKDKLIGLLVNLLKQVFMFIKIENKKNEVDELTENIALLFKKDLIDNTVDIQIEGMTLIKSMEHLAKSKSKTYSSLSNKSIFKYMDILEL
jgi:hypothetical protein